MNAGQVLMVAVLVAVALGVPCCAQDDKDDIQKYLATLDKVDADQILGSQRLLMNTIKCYLDEGPCTPQFRDIKKALPIVFKDSCASCNKDQRNKFKRLMDTLKKDLPQEYEKLAKLYDPEGKYEKAFLEKLNE